MAGNKEHLLCQQLTNIMVSDETKDKNVELCFDLLECDDVTTCSDGIAFNIDAADIYTQDRDGDTLLHIAIILPKTVYIKLFISKAPVPRWLSFSNLLYQTPLHLAAITNQPEVVKQLLVAGAEVDLRDREGNTALHIACREGYHKVVQCLLQPLSLNKKNRNIKSVPLTKIPQNFSIRNYDGVTVLHLAEAYQRYDVIHDLIDVGIDVNMKEGKAGRTILHNACLSGDVTLVKLLLKHKTCNINARAYDGSTPFDLARARCHETICLALAAAGARYGDDDTDSDE